LNGKRSNRNEHRGHGGVVIAQWIVSFGLYRPASECGRL
jgi:hypothetical protein